MIVRRLQRKPRQRVLSIGVRGGLAISDRRRGMLRQGGAELDGRVGQQHVVAVDELHQRIFGFAQGRDWW